MLKTLKAARSSSPVVRPFIANARYGEALYMHQARGKEIISIISSGTVCLCAGWLVGWGRRLYCRV